MISLHGYVLEDLVCPSVCHFEAQLALEREIAWVAELAANCPPARVWARSN